MSAVIRYRATPAGRIAYSVSGSGPPVLCDPGWVSLFGASQGGHVAAAIAARHPERVDALVLYGACASGADLAPAAVRESVVGLVRAHWGLGSKVLTAVFVPGPEAAASAVLALLCWLWRPVPATAWHLTGPAAGAVTAVYGVGWAIVLASTFLISHTDLFGLRRAFQRARRAPYRPPPFTERGLYRLVRHPLMSGFLVVFWAAPAMSAGHLLFAAASTGYILIGIRFEERDLVHDLGESYRGYQAWVPALCPAPRRRARP